MSKEIAVQEQKKELGVLSDFDFKRVCRTRAYESQREKTIELGKLTYLKKDAEVNPDYGKLILSFNDHVKKTLGFSCNEIDKIEDGFLCLAVTNCREKYTLIMDKFVKSWDGTKQHYNEMKAIIRDIPKIERETLVQLGVLK